MTDRWLNLLGLARRAGKVAPGENQTSLAMKRQQVKLLIIAKDAGPSLYRKYHLWAQDLDIPLVRIESKAALGYAIGMGPHAVLAILDEEFGGRILEEMRKSSGGIILDRKREGQSKGLRTGQRAKTGQSQTDRPASPPQGGKYQKSYEHRGAGGGKDGAGHYGRQAASRTEARGQTGTAPGRPGAHQRSGPAAPRTKPSDEQRSSARGSRSHESGGRTPAPKRSR